MVGRKNIRKRGKILLSRAFQEVNEGDSVAVIIERSAQPSFPKRIHGRTGIVKEKRGRAIVVSITEGRKEKKFIIEPIHLKKIRSIQK